MKMEFGAEYDESEVKENANSNITPEEMDQKLQAGKTPEQFLKNYTFDEDQRDVICFRLPELRDIQLYDVVKTVDGLYGVVVALQTFPYTQFKNSGYNIAAFSHKRSTLSSFNMAHKQTYDFSTMNSSMRNQIEVIQLSSQTYATDLNMLKEALAKGQTSWALMAYQITDICEIHKNIHPATKIK